MHSDQNNSRGLGRPWLWLAVAGFLMPWLWAAGYLVSLPEDVLTTNLLLDDSLYFAVPAQHFWQGHGLSFDGLELTNGVQTLWMLVTLALAYVFPEPTMLLRAMVATSALLWLLACLGLFALLRRRSLAGATLAAVGMAWCGVYGRLAFTGMENGISALAAVLVLLMGARVVSQGWSRRGALMLGLGIAVFALCRTEAVLLGPLVGGALMLGWFGRELPWTSRARLTATLAAPGVILVGGALLASRLVFDLWLPISGSVKAFYEQLWAENPPHGGFFENLLWHVRYVFHLAVAPLRDSVPAELSAWTGLRTRWFRNLIWVWLLGSLVFAGWRWRQARRSRAATASAGLRWSFAQVFAIYACAHLVLMATALPHFTDYGSWYFTPEIVTVWLAVGSLVSIARGRLAAVAIAIAALITIAGAMRTSLIAHDMITSRLRSGGMWLEQHVAPGTTVGACSSGLAAWYAPSLHVVNLDGLINNRRYFEDYLKPARVPDYFVDKDIRWFSDYSSLLGWRAGISWQGLVPAERLVPRCYWRLAGERAHGVWQVLPPADSFELLGDRTDVARDRYVELAVAADVHGRFPVVRDVDLAAAIAANPELVVARSIPEEPRLDLLHVLATRQQLQEIDLREGSVFPEHVLHAVAAPGLQVLGFDEVRATLGGEQRFAVTIYWLSTTAQRSQDYQLALCIDGKQVAVASVGDCHGTLPMSQWTPTTVVTETVVLTGKELGMAELRLLQDGRTEPVLRLAR